MFCWPVGWYCNYCAAKLVTVTSHQKQNETSRLSGRPTVYMSRTTNQPARQSCTLPYSVYWGSRSGRRGRACAAPRGRAWRWRCGRRPFFPKAHEFFIKITWKKDIKNTFLPMTVSCVCETTSTCQSSDRICSDMYCKKRGRNIFLTVCAIPSDVRLC